MERTFKRWARPSGSPENVVEEPVGLVPHPDVPAGVHHRRPDPQEVLDKLDSRSA